MGNSYTYIEDVISVAAGVNHGVLYKADGSVYTTGQNIYGQSGTGSFEPEREVRPVQVGVSANDSVKAEWAEIRNSSGIVTKSYSKGAVPDHFTLHVSDELILDADMMWRYYSEGFNLYTDSNSDKATPSGIELISSDQTIGIISLDGTKRHIISPYKQGEIGRASCRERV